MPLLWSLDGARPRRGALIGFVFGLTYYGALLHWLLPFGMVAWLPLALAQAAYAALFGALAAWLRRPGHGPVRAGIAVAAAWVATDWARGSWPLGGFTWGALAYTQHGNHLLLPLASVTGMWGVTFVAVLANVALLRLADRAMARGSGGGAPSWGAVTALVVLALAGTALPGLIPLPVAAGGAVDVAVVQGNVPRELASDRLLQTDQVARNHIALNRELAAKPPDLAVWPENALAGDPTVDRTLGAAVSASIRAVGSPTLVGALADAPGGRIYNQALLYSPQGRITGRYTKVHLVPGGEYVPYPAVLGWTDRYRRGNPNLSPGTGIRVFHVAGTTVGTPICFENVFPGLFRRFVSAGAGLVVLMTNDSSFLESEASREHVIISQVRAVETGRWVVQAAISGESAIIDPTGRIRARTGLFEPAILRYGVPTATARTPYVRFGDWFAWAAALAVLLGILAAVAARRRAGAPPAGEGRREAPPPIRGGAGGPRVLVVLPTYNERQTITRVVTGALAASPSVHVLVVDDSSPDGTSEMVALLAEDEPRIRLLTRPAKQGLASAYLTGFRRALAEGFDVIVEMDSDLSHRPEDLPRLLEGTGRFDLTIGSRYVPGGGVTNWSRTRLGISKAGNAYARAVLGLPVRDATSGYRAYRRELLAALVGDGIHSEGYAFQIELAYRAWRLGYRVGEVPITFREREHGSSKFSRTIVLEALAKVTRWGVRDRLRPPARRLSGSR